MTVTTLERVGAESSEIKIILLDHRFAQVTLRGLICYCVTS